MNDELKGLVKAGTAYVWVKVAWDVAGLVLIGLAVGGYWRLMNVATSVLLRGH